MKKPCVGTILINTDEISQTFLVVDLEPENWKEAIAVRPVFPGGACGPVRIFDPGDIGALRERYNRLGLDEQSQFHAFDAVKKQEMLMPNLPMTWGIPSIDGFGGGILPTIYYSQFTSLLLPENELRTVDGRLGEMLAKPDCRGACIPDIYWMMLTDMRYIITDKVYDIWHDDVAYDTTQATFWQEQNAITIPNEYDEVRILHIEPLNIDVAPIEIQDGLMVTITDEETLNNIVEAEHTIIAVTAVDSRTDDVFLQIQPRLQRMLSSDIKIYQSSEVESRAYLAYKTTILPDDWQGHEDALDILRSGDGFVIHGEDIESLNPIDGEYLTEWLIDSTEFVEYSDTRIVINVSADNDGYIILNDAYYPGWKATVNGEETPVHRANTMFRAVQVPAGESTVVFTFEPELWRVALYIGVGVWLVIVAVLAGVIYRKRE